MKYIIYMDVFFMVNLVMDTLLLKIAAFYIKPQTTIVRCMLSGAVGSLLTCLTLLLSYDNMLVHMLISYFLIAVVLVYVAYGKCSVRQMAKRTGWLYLVTIIMGGAMNLVYDYTYFGYVVQGILSAVYTNPMNLLRMLVFTGISYIILQAMMKLISKAKYGNELVGVKISMKGRSIVLKGLVDTGNSLMDPYYGKPVHIVEYEALQRILEGVDIHREKYRLVPFHSLGKKNGLVEVIELEEMVIMDVYDNTCEANEESEEKIRYVEKNPAIGLYHASLSGEKKYEVVLNGVVSSIKS